MNMDGHTGRPGMVFGEMTLAMIAERDSTGITIGLRMLRDGY